MSTAAYIVVGGCDYYVMFGVKSSFCQSSMLVVQITKIPCKAWYMAAYLGILCPVQRLPWQINKILCIQRPRFFRAIIA